MTEVTVEFELGSSHAKSEEKSDTSCDEVLSFTLPPTDQRTQTAIQRHRRVNHLLCHLKRAILERKGIPILEQVLSFPKSGEPTFDELFTACVFPRVKCSKRERKRETQSKTVMGWCYDENEIQVDPEDTVLDVKFLVAQAIQARPEHVQLLSDYQHRLLDNGAVIAPYLAKDLHYWIELPSDDPKNSSVVIRSVSKLTTLPPKWRSVGEFLRDRLREHGDMPHMGVRKWMPDGSRGPYEYATFRQVNARVSHFAAGLVGLLKVPAGNATRVGICSENRPEWPIADWSAQVQGFVTVPLYETLGKNAIEYIVNHAEVNVVVCSALTIAPIMRALPKCPGVEHVILMDGTPPDADYIRKHPKSGYTHLFSQIEAFGKEHPVDDAKVALSDLSTICYTSGTTGNPKGALISHRNVLVGIYGFIFKMDDEFARRREANPDEENRILSYMPLAHIYGKLVEMLVLNYGSQCAYWQGTPLKLVEDLAEAKPNSFSSVPRVYQKIQDRVMAGVENSNFVRKFLFNRAYAAKLDALENGREPPAFWEKLVFSKIKDVFGGRIRACGSGSAPLSVRTRNFLRVCFAEEVSEGYGLTETFAGGTTTHHKDTKTYGHVGNVGSSCEMKLVDVPDMNYRVTDEPEPRGEIWFRGDNIFEGYYKNKEKTDEVLTADRWFATGDIGVWRSDGKLQIIDRKKNIFKLSQGEYIRPEYIQNVYKMSPMVANVFVYGDSTTSYLVAIVYPDPEVVVPWAQARGIKGGLSEIVKDERVVAAVFADMKRVGEREELNGFEKAKNVRLIAEEFSAENGLLTTTQKLKRPFARKKFEKEIKEMYAEGLKSSKL